MATVMIRRKTVTKATWDRAQVAWRTGGFSKAWQDVRHLAAMHRGIVFPPNGHDDAGWDDPQPTQRAIIARAMVVNPGELRDVLMTPGPDDWSSVVKVLLERWNERDAKAVVQERLDAIRRRDREPSRDQATQTMSSLRSLLGMDR